MGPRVQEGKSLAACLAQNLWGVWSQEGQALRREAANREAQRLKVCAQTLGPWGRETAFLLSKISSVTLHLSLRFLIRKWGFTVATQQGGHEYSVGIYRGYYKWE